MKSGRAALLILLALGVLAAPLGAEAQQSGKVYRIGLLSVQEVQPHLADAFRQGLRDLGYVQGHNTVIEYRWALPDQLPKIAAEMVRLRPDVIVANGTPTIRAAKQATTTIPIVMVGIGLDPTALGLVASLARPGGNVTGIAALGTDLWGKRLALLRDALPGVSRVAVLSNPGNPGNVLAMKEITGTAPATRLILLPLDARNAAELDRAFAEITRQRPDALVTVWDQFLLSQAGRIAKFAASRQLPTLGAIREYADAGALMSYAANIPDQWRRAAVYVDRILKGTSPADLPVEQPTRFELIINLKTAKALGLTIPPSLLLRADHVIE
jgi:putative tryptophan/tyrosine transport system substrate-binding protein